MGCSKNEGKKHESCNENRNRDFNFRVKVNRDDFCDAVRECREKKHESSSCEKREHHKKRCCRCRRSCCCCRSSW